MLAVIIILIINITIFRNSQKQQDNEDRGKIIEVSPRYNSVRWVLSPKVGCYLTYIALKCPVLLASQSRLSPSFLPLLSGSKMNLNPVRGIY